MKVNGHCPACGRRTLYLRKDGTIACSREDCPRPMAVTEILADGETAHVVELHQAYWSAKHPLIERLDGALLTCDIGEKIAEHRLKRNAPQVGTFRVGGAGFRKISDD